MNSFQDLSLSPQVMRAIADLGFEKPSPIQEATLPILLGEPTDFLGLAATGTGKTAAFAIPIIEQIDLSKKVVQALILCPTRELALQVAEQIDLLGKHKGVRALPVYGGSAYGEQINGLKHGVPIVVGTPGRVLDHIERGRLRLGNLKTIVLDEADRMISMGFKEEIEKILDSTDRETSQIWLFSATMGHDVRRVADEYLRKPKQVQINKTEMLAEGVEQIYFITSEANKTDILCKLLDAEEDFYGLIFCQTKTLVTDLVRFLSERGYRVDCLHGDMDQNSRERTMKAFRDRRVKVLVCTDVASRGLDVKNISHVINYSIPRELDNYVHRIGRTARSGESGIAISLVTPSHRVLIGRIEKMTKSKMREGKIPTRKDIGIKKVGKILEQFTAVKEHARAVELMGADWVGALLEMDKEEIVGRFLALKFPELFENRTEHAKAKPAAIVKLPDGPVRKIVLNNANRGLRREPSRDDRREGRYEQKQFFKRKSFK